MRAVGAPGALRCSPYTTGRGPSVGIVLTFCTASSRRAGGGTCHHQARRPCAAGNSSCGQKYFASTRQSGAIQIPHLQPRRLHAVLQPACCPQQVAQVLRQRGDGGDGHQVNQLAVVGTGTPAHSCSGTRRAAFVDQCSQQVRLAWLEHRLSHDRHRWRRQVVAEAARASSGGGGRSWAGMPARTGDQPPATCSSTHLFFM